MNYVSTRGKSEPVSSAQAILQGIAGDGGLFVPTEIPKVDADFLKALTGLSYADRAKKILGLFLTDYSDEEIGRCVESAYGGGKFDDEAVAPVRSVGDVSVLELWHGPTSAFKDMALQLLPRLLSEALKKTGETKETLILVATSGDTGKAALAGFADVPQTKIMVFYPEGGVSEMQRLQMVTQAGGNVSVVAVKGNFDDAQGGVKEIFGDTAFAAKLGEAGVRLSSANSINWGRLVPQIVYYFSAYADMVKAGTIQNGAPVNFTVPTGNFGNILAGFYARQMGLPVGKLVCASNRNNVLTDFLQTGYYDRNRDFFKTISPSMDILVSSNVERMLYHMTGDPSGVRGWMEALATEGRYDAGVGMIQRFQNYFWAGWADDEKTKATIREVYETEHYVLDTHTAVAWTVAREYRRRTHDERPMVVVSTASPYKFSGSVLEALGGDATGEPFALLASLEQKSGMTAPKGLAALKDAQTLHEGSCEKEKMRDAVLAFAEK
ncbi:MAG: threonine synthase [Schwartzia sp.]|nr:threonine synthase [Schwartzia sp. (in: firmicutes)]